MQLFQLLIFTSSFSNKSLYGFRECLLLLGPLNLGERILAFLTTSSGFRLSNNIGGLSAEQQRRVYNISNIGVGQGWISATYLFATNYLTVWILFYFFFVIFFVIFYFNIICTGFIVEFLYIGYEL